MIRSSENVTEAKRLIASEVPMRKVAEMFGVAVSTVRLWIDETYYQRHIERNRKRVTRDTREQINQDKLLSYRRNYLGGQKFQRKMQRFREKHGQACQQIFAQTFRRAVLGHADRQGEMWRTTMTAVTGMEWQEFTEKFKDGRIEFVIPLEAFDLTYAEHVVRAIHPSNIRTVPAGDPPPARTAAAVDWETLPWVGTELAFWYATGLIARFMSQFKRSSKEPMVE
jgi:hypothetical protein